MKWIAVYYREGNASVELTEEQIAAGAGPDPAPARAFLNALPLSPRAGLRATIVAVRDRPPPSFPTGSQAWRLMHKSKKKGEVDMSGIFEARDRHQRRLYRLFCVLDSRAPEHGLAAPTLVMLSGTLKNVGEEVPQAVYRKVRRQADRYFATSPRPVIPFG
ncbi:MAG: hypothetical protein ACRDLK_13460 [Gaiellaceae bacterium]